MSISWDNYEHINRGQEHKRLVTHLGYMISVYAFLKSQYKLHQ